MFPPQVLAAIGISFGASIVGGWLSFSSVAIPKMMNGTTPGDPIQIDLFLGSWIASLFFIGNIVGCVAGGIVNQVDSASDGFCQNAMKIDKKGKYQFSYNLINKYFQKRESTSYKYSPRGWGPEWLSWSQPHWPRSRGR